MANSNSYSFEIVSNFGSAIAFDRCNQGAISTINFTSQVAISTINFTEVDIATITMVRTITTTNISSSTTTIPKANTKSITSNIANLPQANTIVKVARTTSASKMASITITRLQFKHVEAVDCIDFTYDIISLFNYLDCSHY